MMRHACLLLEEKICAGLRPAPGNRRRVVPGGIAKNVSNY